MSIYNNSYDLDAYVYDVIEDLAAYGIKAGHDLELCDVKSFISKFAESCYRAYYKYKLRFGDRLHWIDTKDRLPEEYCYVLARFSLFENQRPRQIIVRYIGNNLWEQDNIHGETTAQIKGDYILSWTKLPIPEDPQKNEKKEDLLCQTD